MITRIFLFTTILTLSACSMPEYRASVVKFGEATELTATKQGQRLDNLTDRQRQDILKELATKRVVLSYSAGCAQLAVPGSDPKACYVVGTDGKRIPQAETFGGLEALNKALGQYSQSLKLLASDTTEDAATFNASLLELAASADGLIAAVQETTGPTENAAALTSAATISGALANAAFGAARASRLRDIIIEMDPVVQESAKQLAQMSEALTLSEAAASVDAIEDARTKLSANISSGASTAVVAKNQAALIEKVTKAKRTAQLRDPYAKIAKAHAELAKASRQGASQADIKASVLELLALAQLLKSEAETF